MGLVHAFPLSVQPLKVKLDLGQVHLITNSEKFWPNVPLEIGQQTNFGLIFHMGLVSSWKINGQNLSCRCPVICSKYPSPVAGNLTREDYRQPTELILKGKLLYICYNRGMILQLENITVIATISTTMTRNNDNLLILGGCTNKHSDYFNLFINPY